MGASFAGLTAAVLLAVGGFALWGDSHKDADGFLSTGTERFATDTRALVSDNLDLDLSGAESLLDEGELGTLRLEATPRHGEPVFVGVAHSSDVSAYLDEVAHATVTDFDFEPFRASYDRHDGVRRPAPPAESNIWAKSASGPGSQTLTWKVEDGDWSVVVMNADGSPRVQADVRAGAKVPLLGQIGWLGLIGGSILLAGAAGLGVLAVRGGVKNS